MIRDVNTCIKLIIHDTTDEGNDPLRRVRAHYSDGRSGIAAKLMTSLSEAKCILPVLVPRPAYLLIVTLNP